MKIIENPKRAIERLRANGAFQEVVDWADAELAKGHDCDVSELHNVRAEALYELGRYEESLPSFAYLLSSKSDAIEFSVFQKARSAVERALTAEAQKDFWNTCTDAHSRRFAIAKRLLLDGRADDAQREFNSVIWDVVPDGQTARAWQFAFGTIAAAFDGDSSQEPAEISSVNKIIVSGMGWSGSGALFDYFREFLSVSCSVKSEHRYIEGAASLLQVYKTVLRGRDWDVAFLDFFFTSVLGFNELSSAGDFKAVKRARVFSLDAKNASVFARAVERCMPRAALFINSNEDNRVQRFREFASDFVNLVSSGAYLYDADHYLLDNCIHIGKLEAVEFIDNAKIFAVFRDPRSNFVALRREMASYRESASAFIRKKRKQYRKLNKLVRKAAEASHGSSNLVAPVQFERFVLDRQYRESLALCGGLSLTERNEYCYFKPWQSRKNVYLHESWDPQSEILEIERELSKYCIDLSYWQDEDGT